MGGRRWTPLTAPVATIIIAIDAYSLTFQRWTTNSVATCTEGTGSGGVSRRVATELSRVTISRGPVKTPFATATRNWRRDSPFSRTLGASSTTSNGAALTGT